MVITEPENTAVGDQALVNNTGHSNTATGFQSLFTNTTGSDNTANGAQALVANTTGISNTATGSQALLNNTTGTPQFGLIAEEVAEVNPDLVVRDENGEIYTVRYDAVNAMLLNEFLKEHRRVEKQQATIGRFEATAAKQEATIAELKSTVAKQEKGLQTVTARLEHQSAQIQKVSAQLAAASPSPGGLETSNPAPRVVANKP